jgi:tRNA-dihydrouridine synthase B
MQKTFWETLEKPVLALAPMDGITEIAFRTITKKYGQPDLMYTEFVSVEGLCHNAIKLLDDFIYDQAERPLIAQIFGVTPEYFYQVSIMLCELGFDGIDINMGCPAKSMHKQGSGANLINTPKLAQKIIRETKKGVEDFFTGKRSKDCPDLSPRIVAEVEKRSEAVEKHPSVIPVSVKTRIGYDKPTTKEWIGALLEEKPAAIALHGRTLKQSYRGRADWEEIGKAVELAKDSGVLILGNGDVKNRTETEKKCNKYGTAGVLIGRGSFGNPFAFSKNPPTKNIFEIALEHAQLYEKTYLKSENKNHHFLPMRKHLGWYVKSMPRAKEIRSELFRANTAGEVETIFKKFELI